MIVLSRKKSITAFAVSLLFFLSSLAVPGVMASANSSHAPLAAATPLTSLQANWAYTDGNQFAQDYSPQTQINSSNAQNLGITWLAPMPGFPPALQSIVTTRIGVDTTPLIVNGTVYAVTQEGQVIALNAATGNQLWTDILPINANSTVGQGTGVLQLHLHQGEQAFTASSKFFGGTPTYWISAPNHIIYAINALTGKYENITKTTLDGGFAYYTGVNNGIDGNSPTSTYAGAATTSSNIVFDTQRGILLTGQLVPSTSAGARCFVKGWDMTVTPPTNIWTSYCTPPQPNSNVALDPNWIIKQVNNMTGAQIFYPGPQYNGGGTIPASAVVDLKTLSAAQLNATLYNDWGYVNQSPACQAATGGQSTGSTGSGWGGSWLIDSKTGLGYINTGNRGPYAGACNPGPDLWSDSILALNDQTGKWVWGFQTSAHDDWDYDCSWYQGLGNETISGVNTEVLFKTCKNGYLYELNALNGKMIWAWTPPTIILPRTPYTYMQNPLNQSQMTNAWAAPNLQNFVSNPSELAGFESTASFDPQANMVFVVSHNVPAIFHYVAMNTTNYAINSGIQVIGGQPNPNLPDNATIEGINAATGQMVWSHNIPKIGFRGGIMSSGNVVFSPLASGDLLMLNAQSGALIKDLFIGAPSAVVPAIGATTSGVEEVILTVGSGGQFGPTAVPGDLVALQLENVGVTTVVSTSLATTTVGGATVTTTVGGGAAQTVTLTATTTATAAGSGFSATTVYGIAAVAAIFIIATGYLAMRGRKPAS